MTLFNVRIRHSYYNLAGNACPDFAVVPTSGCAALMARLGLLFRDQGDGFSVSVPRSRIPAVAGCVAGASGSTSADHGPWTRLSFLLVLKSPDFVGITALPLGTSPTQQALYVSNLETTASGGVLLFGGSGGLDASTLCPVTGPAVAVQTTADATITLSDVSGQAACSVDTTANTASSLSLAGSPYGLYTLSATPASACAGPQSVVYVPSRPLASGMVELLLTQPAAGTGDPAAFPVGPLPVPPSSGPTTSVASVQTVPVQTVTLTLSFQSRRTIWQYYIVSQGGRGRFGQSLSITGSAATFTQAAEPVTLPNGDEAVLFSSTTALPLQQHSSCRFTLNGQRQGSGGSRDDIAVNRLPSAPASPVWPAATGDPSSGSSEIFVYV